MSTKAGAVSEPALGRYPSMKAESFFLEANDEYVADIHRGYSTAGAGKVDTVWALVWHFTIGGKVDRVVNLSGDQHQMDSCAWKNYTLAPLLERLALTASPSVCAQLSGW
ncbi:hypothetical protein [Nocardia sp. NPDC051981]|uniref:hypothetical protein n=1 Tax=Nocardia sp. NPDC051981 TaxID=3155417 RepID=UPI00343A87FF